MSVATKWNAQEAMQVTPYDCYDSRFMSSFSSGCPMTKNDSNVNANACHHGHFTFPFMMPTVTSQSHATDSYFLNYHGTNTQCSLIPQGNIPPISGPLASHHVPNAMPMYSPGDNYGCNYLPSMAWHSTSQGNRSDSSSFQVILF